MTRNRIALAAFATAALILAATPASAHGTCTVTAGNPWETFYNGEYVAAGNGLLSCEQPHDRATYNLNICLYYSPVVLPGSGTIQATGLPPLARPVVCGFASEKSDSGAYGAIYAPCPYLPGYYQTYVFNGRAGAHTNIIDKYDYSSWMFLPATNCL